MPLSHNIYVKSYTDVTFEGTEFIPNVRYNSILFELNSKCSCWLRLQITLFESIYGVMVEYNMSSNETVFSFPLKLMTFTIQINQMIYL